MRVSNVRYEPLMSGRVLVVDDVEANVKLLEAKLSAPRPRSGPTDGLGASVTRLGDLDPGPRGAIPPRMRTRHARRAEVNVFFARPGTSG